MSWCPLARLSPRRSAAGLKAPETALWETAPALSPRICRQLATKEGPDRRVLPQHRIGPSAITAPMGNTFTRREALVGAAASAGALLAAAAPATIETHVHLFDPGRVPYAPDAPYQQIGRASCRERV